MIHYRPKISHTCPHDTTFIYKPKAATDPTKMGLSSLRPSPYMLYNAWTYQKTRTYISITSNTLFRSLSVTFSPTYSFDVLVEAFVDTATPRLLLSLQSYASTTMRLLAPSCSPLLFLSSRTFDPPCCFNSPMTLTLVWGWLSCVDPCWFLRILQMKEKTILTVPVSQMPHAV